VPYQLHCCRQLFNELLLELSDDVTTAEDLDEATEEGADEEAGGVPEHTAPFIVGRSSAPPFLFNWKPMLAVAPG